jgi:hypothetical protein
MHLAVQGYGALGRNEFAAAAHWYAQVAAMSNAPDWAHYQLARCQAMLGDTTGALASLRCAIEHGWSEWDQMRANPHFASLHEYPEWHEMIENHGE